MLGDNCFLSDLLPPDLNWTSEDRIFEALVREGISGVSSLSPMIPGESWFSGPDEKSVSICRCGVVNDGLRN